MDEVRAFWERKGLPAPSMNGEAAEASSGRFRPAPARASSPDRSGTGAG
jgi:hypothetical protein